MNNKIKSMIVCLTIAITVAGCQKAPSDNIQPVDATDALINNQNQVTITKLKDHDNIRLGGEKFFDVQYETQRQDPFVALICDSDDHNWIQSSFVYMNNGRGSRGYLHSKDEVKHVDFIGYLTGKQVDTSDYTISTKYKQYSMDQSESLGNGTEISFTVKTQNKMPGILFCKVILNNVCMSCCEPVCMIDGIGMGRDNGILDTGKKIKVKSIKVVPLYFVEATELNRDEYSFNGEKNECEIPGYFGIVDTINLPNYKDGIVIVSSETYQSKKNTVCIDNNCTMCVDGKADYSALYSESFDIEKPKTEDVKKHSLSVYYIPVQMVGE